MSAGGPGQSPALLPEVVAVLDQACVGYAVIGAMAMAFHGVIRASLDVDLLLFPTSAPLPPLEKNFAAARVVAAEHEGTPLRFIGLEDLVAMKLYAGGAQDVEDARRLLQAAGDAADVELLRRLASGFGPREPRVLDELLAGR